MSMSANSLAKLNVLIGVQTLAQTLVDQIQAYSVGALAAQPAEKALIDNIKAGMVDPLAVLDHDIILLQEVAAQE